MSQVSDSLRMLAGPEGVARRGLAGFALGAWLLAASAAAAQGPDRATGPYLAAGQERGPTVTAARLTEVDSRASATARRTPATSMAEAPSDSDAPAFTVRSAEWLQSIDGSSDQDSTDTLGLRRVTLVSGETAPDDRAPARTPVAATVSRSPAADNSAAAAADGNASPADETRSRLAWPASTERFDPAETLREWAEGAGLLIAFGIVSLWIVRQYLAKRTQTSGPTKHMQLIESLWLPQRCRVHLVEAGGRQVLVTTDAGGVKNVTVLPDRFAALLDDGAADAAPEVVAPAGPADVEHGRVWNSLRESRLT